MESTENMQSRVDDFNDNMVRPQVKQELASPEREKSTYEISHPVPAAPEARMQVDPPPYVFQHQDATPHVDQESRIAGLDGEEDAPTFGSNRGAFVVGNHGADQRVDPSYSSKFQIQQSDDWSSGVARCIRQMQDIVQQIPQQVQSGISLTFRRQHSFIGKSSDRKQIRSLRKELVASKQEVQNWKDRATGLQSALETAQQASKRELERTSNVIRDLELKHDDACRSRDAAIKELDSRPKLESRESLANARKVSDATIETEWKQFTYNIRNLAHFLAESPPKGHLSKHMKGNLRDLDSEYVKMLQQNEEYRAALLEAVICRAIFDSVFDSDCGIVGREKASIPCKFNSIRAELINDNLGRFEPLGKLGPWLAQGFQFMERKQYHEDFQQSLTQLLHNLHPFFGVAPGYVAPHVRQQLHAIIKTAFELDEIFMSSKAVFYFRWTDKRQVQSRTNRYRADWMTASVYDGNLSDRSNVKFVISPTLFKIGNADGMNYDSCQVLAKAKVVCD